MQIKKLFTIALAALLPMTTVIFQTARAQLVENSTTAMPSAQEIVKSVAIARQSKTYIDQITNFIQSCTSRLEGGDKSVLSD